MDHFLRNSGAIDYGDDDYSDDEYTGPNAAAQDDEDADTSPRIFLPSETHCDRLVLIEVLAPLTQTYVAVAQCLTHLIGCHSMVESEFVKVCIKEIRERVERGTCKYGESISTDTIRNCIKLLEKWQVISISMTAGARLINLRPKSSTPLGVKATIDRIKKFIVN